MKTSAPHKQKSYMNYVAVGSLSRTNWSVQQMIAVSTAVDYTLTICFYAVIKWDPVKCHRNHKISQKKFGFSLFIDVCSFFALEILSCFSFSFQYNRYFFLGCKSSKFVIYSFGKWWVYYNVDGSTYKTKFCWNERRKKKNVNGK